MALKECKRRPGESVHRHLHLSILSLKYALHASRHAEIQKAQSRRSKHLWSSQTDKIHTQISKIQTCHFERYSKYTLVFSDRSDAGTRWKLHLTCAFECGAELA